MKSATKEIPILEGADLHKIHFGRRLAEFPFEETYFYARRLEENRSKINFPLPPHRKTVYDFIFITKGESVRSKGLNEYHFQKNQIFFLPAYQITTHESMSEDIEGFFVHFSSKLFADYAHLLNGFNFLKFNTYPIISIPDDAIEPVVNLFERLTELFGLEGDRPQRKLIWYLMALFSEIEPYTSRPNQAIKDTAARLTQQYKDTLSEHIYTYRSVAEFADHLHVTPNHLNKCVKKTVNKTAQGLLNEMLLLEAKSLLKYSELSISEIATKLFRSSSSNFSRFFKSQAGISPNNFRHSKQK